MHKEGEEVHLNPVESSGGEKLGVMRYVLLISLALIVVLFLVLLLYWK